MSFNKKSIKDIDLTDKRVLLRVDYNVPVEEGKITDDYRIKKSLPTIEYLLEKNAKVIICSHLGRPEGVKALKYSLKPCADRLAKLVGKEVDFASDCVGAEASEKINNLGSGQILLLENLRFHEGEEKNDKEFAKQLSEHADVFVQDGFGVVHRAHASTDAISQHLPSVSGLLLQNEVEAITKVMESPEKPLVAVVGGAKISDKLSIINKFIDMADVVVVGGAMANTFLRAQGVSIGKSLHDHHDIAVAKEILDKAKDESRKRQFVFYLPQDAVVATDSEKPNFTRVVDWGVHAFASIQNYPKNPPNKYAKVLSSEMILDVGPSSASFMAGAIQLAKTVVWNGTLGVTETKAIHGPIGPFSHGTEILVDAMTGQFGHKPFSVVGGGDTVAYIENRKLTGHFDHVSTGGGASMELMSGKKLPGVEALANKE